MLKVATDLQDTSERTVQLTVDDNSESPRLEMESSGKKITTMY